MHSELLVLNDVLKNIKSSRGSDLEAWSNVSSQGFFYMLSDHTQSKLKHNLIHAGHSQDMVFSTRVSVSLARWCSFPVGRS